MTTGNDWFEQARRVVAGLGQSLGAASAGPSADDHPDDCRWCPVCQVAAVVRGERPEVTTALADALSAAADALRRAAAAPAAPAEEPTDEPPAADGAEPGPPVQRIEIA